MGQSYAIATKDYKLKTLPLSAIKNQISNFIRYAYSHPSLRFIVTPVGCGLVGYKPKDIALLFYEFVILDNIVMPEEFRKYSNNIDMN